MNPRVLRWLNVTFVAALIGIGGGRYEFATVVGGQESGGLTIENRIGRGVAIPLTQPNFLLAQGIAGQQVFSRQDLLFLVRYDYLFQVAPPYLGKLSDVGELRVELPGSVIRSNADNSQELSWEKVPSDGMLSASTRVIRWWLVAFTAAIAATNGFIRWRQRMGIATQFPTA